MLALRHSSSRSVNLKHRKRCVGAEQAFAGWKAQAGSVPSLTSGSLPTAEIFSTRVEQTYLPLNGNRYERGLRLFQPLHGRRVIIDPVMPPEQDGVLEDADGHLPDFSVRVRTQLVPE